MNTTFNFSRFLKVLSNEWRLNIKKMLLFWGSAIVLTVIFFVFFRYVEPSGIRKNNTFTLSFFIMCIMQGFYLHNYYHEFSSKTKTQALFLLPASQSEKFWAKFLLGIILYPVIFSIYIFIVLKWNGIHNDWIRELKGGFLSDEIYQRSQTLTLDFITRIILFLVWLSSASCYLFGNMLFKKRPALKSFVFWFIVGIGLSLITSIVYALFTGVWPSAAFPGIVIVENKVFECAIHIMYPELLYGLGIFICLALILISRIKYNEKTI